MTIVAARDLASKQIRVCTIAPGTFDTPLLARLSDDVRGSLAATVPHPSRLGDADEYARLAMAIVDNGMLNGKPSASTAPSEWHPGDRHRRLHGGGRNRRHHH